MGYGSGTRNSFEISLWHSWPVQQLVSLSHSYLRNPFHTTEWWFSHKCLQGSRLGQDFLCQSVCVVFVLFWLTSGCGFAQYAELAIHELFSTLYAFTVVDVLYCNSLQQKTSRPTSVERIPAPLCEFSRAPGPDVAQHTQIYTGLTANFQLSLSYLAAPWILRDDWCKFCMTGCHSWCHPWCSQAGLRRLIFWPLTNSRGNRHHSNLVPWCNTGCNSLPFVLSSTWDRCALKVVWSGHLSLTVRR